MPFDTTVDDDDDGGLSNNFVFIRHNASATIVSDVCVYFAHKHHNDSDSDEAIVEFIRVGLVPQGRN